MSDYSQEYHHSGKRGSSAFFVPILASPATIILGILYGFVTVYNPFIYVSSVGTIGYGTAIGWVVSQIGHRAHCRNPKFLILMGILMGLFGLYCAWVGFLYALTIKAGGPPLSYFGFLISPPLVWNALLTLNATGWFSLFGLGAVKGGVLSIIWIIEALLIVIVPGFFAARAITSRVYCEETGTWCELQDGFLQLERPHTLEELPQLKAGDLQPLANLYRVDRHAGRFLKVNCHRGRPPSSLAAFQHFMVTRVKDQNGKTEEKLEQLTPIYLVPGEALELFDSWAQTKTLRPKKLPPVETQ